MTPSLVTTGCMGNRSGSTSGSSTTGGVAGSVTALEECPLNVFKSGGKVAGWVTIFEHWCDLCGNSQPLVHKYADLQPQAYLFPPPL
jgi:hypothetical protein